MVHVGHLFFLKIKPAVVMQFVHTVWLHSLHFTRWLCPISRLHTGHLVVHLSHRGPLQIVHVFVWCVLCMFCLHEVHVTVSDGQSNLLQVKQYTALVSVVGLPHSSHTAPLK